MANITFITGGAASGKSRWAVSYFSSCDDVLYMETSAESDAETEERIKWNSEHNGVNWVVKTGCGTDDPDIENHKFFIFDNLANYTSKIINEMCLYPDSADEIITKKIKQRVIGDVAALMDKMQEIDGNIIIISLETGFSICPENKKQAFFREVLGAVNQRIANMASEVYVSISGIQVKIK